MRAVVQRVASAAVRVGGDQIAAIERGLLVLLGVARDDTEAEAEWLAAKVANLRIFADAEGKFAHSVCDMSAAVLVVSQFTLYADTRKGRRPSFAAAATGSEAARLYQHFAARLRDIGLAVDTGRFGAAMEVSLINDGPVTIILDTPAPSASRLD